MNAKSQLEWFYTLPNIVKTTSSFPKIKWQIANRAKANVIRSSQQQTNEAAVARILYAELLESEPGQVIVDNWTAFLSRHSVKAAHKVKNMMLGAGLLSPQESGTVLEEILSIGFTLVSVRK